MITAEIRALIEEHDMILSDVPRARPVQFQLDTLETRIDRLRSSLSVLEQVGTDNEEIININQSISNITVENKHPTKKNYAIAGEHISKGVPVGMDTLTQRGYEWTAKDPLFEYIGVSMKSADTDEKVTCMICGELNLNDNTLVNSKNIFVDNTGTLTHTPTAEWAKIGVARENGKALLIEPCGFTPSIVSTIKLADTDITNFMQLKWNENDSADRILNVLIGGADRSLTFEDDTIVGQDYSVDSTTVRFDQLHLGGVNAAADTNVNLHIEDTAPIILLQKTGTGAGSQYIKMTTGGDLDFFKGDGTTLNVSFQQGGQVQITKDLQIGTTLNMTSGDIYSVDHINMLDNAVGDPSIRFVGDQDTGAYYDSGTAFAYGGVKILTINAALTMNTDIIMGGNDVKLDRGSKVIFNDDDGDDNYIAGNGGDDLEIWRQGVKIIDMTASFILLNKATKVHDANFYIDNAAGTPRMIYDVGASAGRVWTQYSTSNTAYEILTRNAGDTTVLKRFSLPATTDTGTATFENLDYLALDEVGLKVDNIYEETDSVGITFNNDMHGGANDFDGLGSATIGNVMIPGIFTAEQEPTGIQDIGDSTISFNTGTRLFTIASVGASFDYYVNGVKTIVTTSSTVTIGDTTGLHFIYYLGGTLTDSLVHWDFNEDKVFVGMVYWRAGGADALLMEERHGLAMDWATHKYLHETVNTRYESGLGGTFNDNNTFQIELGEIQDEDLVISISQQTNCRIIYQDGASKWHYDAAGPGYFKETADIIQYDDESGTPQDVDNAKYVAYWIFATNDIDYPIWSMMGQGTHNTLATAKLDAQPSSLILLDLPSHEMKLLFRVIIKRAGTGESVEDVADYRAVSNLAIGNYVATDHGTLTGLADDDHVQYLPITGIRAMTGALDMDTQGITDVGTTTGATIDGGSA